MPQSKHIAVVGAGPSGSGIAQLFAAKGHEVTLFDRNEELLKAAIGKIESDLVFLSQNGLDVGQGIRSAIERIKLSANLQEAITDARFVVETVEENLETKQLIFREMEAFCSSITILATSTTSFLVSEIAAKMKIKKRVVGTHFWYPSDLIPLVEVMGGGDTLPEVKGYVCDLLLSIGMRPVLINKEVPGLLGYRLQQALRREALSIVDQGIASPADVDELIKEGVGIRLSAFGLLENEHMDGFDATAWAHVDPERMPPSSFRLREVAESDQVSIAIRQEPSLWHKGLISKRRAELVRQQASWNGEKRPGVSRK